MPSLRMKSAPTLFTENWPLLDDKINATVYGTLPTHQSHNWAFSVTLVAVRVQKSKPSPFWPDFLDPGHPIFRGRGQGAAIPPEPNSKTLRTLINNEIDATSHFVKYGTLVTHPRHNWPFSVTLVARW